jgi:putative ABC transport system permease protein
MVLGSRLAKSLYQDGVSLGKKIKIEGRIYSIIGVLKESGLTDSSGARSIDDMAFIPPRSGSVPGMGMGRPVMSLTFFVKDKSKLDQAVRQLQAHFDRELGAGQVRVESRQAALNARRSAQSALLGAVAGLALLCMVVASLNIFNVSSIKTIRRRQSLGILRAMGASRASALGCFVVELLALSAAGTVAGLALALPLAPSTAALLSAGAAKVGGGQLAAMIFVALASMVLPLAAGLFPAWRILGQAPADLVRPE